MKYLVMGLLSLAALQVRAEVVNTEPAALTTISINAEGEHLLADTKGNTLYVFDLDQNKATPACNGNCAEVWPPYLLTGEEVQLLKAPYGVISRDNKKAQLTYQGRPVYAYALDRGLAADADDGVGGVWHYIELEVK